MALKFIIHNMKGNILNDAAYKALPELHKSCFERKIMCWVNNGFQGTRIVEFSAEIFAIADDVKGMWVQIKPTPLDFGDYCTIEQKRFGVENEHYLHKVIGRLCSNTWVDVPVFIAEKDERIHDEIQPVLLCICCGVDETIVKRYLETDCKPTLVNKR